MPYMRQGKTVYQLKGDEWKVYKTEPSEAKAKALLTALRINVEKKEHIKEPPAGKYPIAK